jgi:hypothetical protein
MMPPSGAKRPERSALDHFAAEVESRLDKAVDPNAALVTPALHRLNRTEYANAIRDLLGLDINVNTLLPADGSSQGFDNLAEALAVSPSLIQGYVSAAMKISRLAVGDRTLAPLQTTFAPPAGLAQDRHIDGLPLGTRGGVVFHHTFPLDAEYEFAFGGRGAGPGGLDLTLDGAQVKVDNPRGFRMKVTAGPHVIGLALVDRQRGAGVDEIYSDFRTNATFTTQGGVPTLVVTGPFNATGAGDTPSRRAIFSCKPASAAEETTCARTILSSLARRAYRGPVSAAEVNTLLAFYQEGRRAATSTAVSSKRWRASWSHRGSCIASKKSRRPSRLVRSTASATSSSLHACRSFCGAASRTRNCVMWRRRAGCATRRRSRSR